MVLHPRAVCFHAECRTMPAFSKARLSGPVVAVKGSLHRALPALDRNHINPHPLRFQKRPISLVDQRQKSIRNLVKEASYFLICRWFRFITLRRIFGIYAIETVGRDGRQSRVAAAPICGHHRGPRRRLTDGSKIRTHWKVVIIFFDHPHRTWSWANVREPRRNFAVRNSWTQGATAAPIRNVRFRHSTIRRPGARRPPPREDPAQAPSRAGWRLRQSYHRLQQPIAVLFSRR